MIMRPPADYVALHDLQVPDTFVFAARTGDDVTEAQRVNLGLVVGVDVRPLRTDSMARPNDDAERSAWQDYAVVQGVPYTEAVDLDRAELIKRIDRQDEEGPADPTTMPEPGALKAEWLEYAVVQVMGAAGVIEQEARDRLAGLTKAELIDAFGPEDADGDWDHLLQPANVPAEQLGPHQDTIA
jgi:hypothetical protein